MAGGRETRKILNIREEKPEAFEKLIVVSYSAKVVGERKKFRRRHPTLGHRASRLAMITSPEA